MYGFDKLTAKLYEYVGTTSKKKNVDHVNTGDRFFGICLSFCRKFNRYDIKSSANVILIIFIVFRAVDRRKHINLTKTRETQIKN